MEGGEIDEERLQKKAEVLFKSIKRVHITFVSMDAKHLVERLFW